tara:strand:- start:226 stop:369 length:144 start_codon:yes stop_codon:yes gene_type:complete
MEIKSNKLLKTIKTLRKTQFSYKETISIENCSFSKEKLLFSIETLFS